MLNQFPTRLLATLALVALCMCSCQSSRSPAPDPDSKAPSLHQHGMRCAFDSAGLRAVVMKLRGTDFEQDGVLRITVRKDKKSREFWHKDLVLPETANMTWWLDHIKRYNCPLGQKEGRELILIVYAYGWGTGGVVQTEFKLAIVEILDNDVRLVFNDLIGNGGYGHSLYEDFGRLEYSMSFLDIKSVDGKITLTIFDRDQDVITGIRKYVLGKDKFVRQE